jgi:hypothetical protein
MIESSYSVRSRPWRRRCGAHADPWRPLRLLKRARSATRPAAADRRDRTRRRPRCLRSHDPRFGAARRRARARARDSVQGDAPPLATRRPKAAGRPWSPRRRAGAKPGAAKPIGKDRHPETKQVAPRPAVRHAAPAPPGRRRATPQARGVRGAGGRLPRRGQARPGAPEARRRQSRHYTERLDAQAGPLTRLRAGPFPRAKPRKSALATLKLAALDGKVVPLHEGDEIVRRAPISRPRDCLDMCGIVGVVARSPSTSSL